MKSTGKIPNRKVFSERLAFVRTKLGKNASEMAKLLGFSQPVYHRYEHGRMPEIHTVMEIADRCGVPAEWLLGIDSSQAGQMIGLVNPKENRESGSASGPAPGEVCRIPATCDVAAEVAGLKSRLEVFEDRTLHITRQLDTLLALLGGAMKSGLQSGAGAEVKEKAG